MTLKLWKRWKADFIKRWKGKRPHCKYCGETLKPDFTLKRVLIEGSGWGNDTRSDYRQDPEYWGYDRHQNFCSLRCGITWANRQLGKREIFWHKGGE